MTSRGWRSRSTATIWPAAASAGSDYGSWRSDPSPSSWSTISKRGKRSSITYADTVRSHRLLSVGGRPRVASHPATLPPATRRSGPELDGPRGFRHDRRFPIGNLDRASDRDHPTGLQFDRGQSGPDPLADH